MHHTSTPFHSLIETIRRGSNAAIAGAVLGALSPFIGNRREKARLPRDRLRVLWFWHGGGADVLGPALEERFGGGYVEGASE